MRSVIESRPLGALDAVAEKIEYWTHEGQKTLYLIVSFLPVPTADGRGTVDRAIEFFMPVGQSGESQQWITSSMRLLSLAARGGFLERALALGFILGLGVFDLAGLVQRRLDGVAQLGVGGLGLGHGVGRRIGLGGVAGGGQHQAGQDQDEAHGHAPWGGWPVSYPRAAGSIR